MAKEKRLCYIEAMTVHVATLPDAPIENRIAAYEQQMQFGPARSYWSEFVFKAYLNHRPDVIFLKGLPDIPEGRPHARANSQ